MPLPFAPPVPAYLARIGLPPEQPVAPDLAALRGLQQAHLLTVPFENLSIARRELIILDEARLYDKIVTRRRGGFCYELNGLFAALLRALGYRVTLLSARVDVGNKRAPEFDHLALRVDLEQSWLVDVGFGAGPGAPLRIDAPVPADGPDGTYRVVDAGAERILQRRDDAAASWRDEYRFTLASRRFDEFAGMCQYHQTSPDSPFTRNRVCSLARPHGRITLSGMRLIVTHNGARSESVLDSEAAAETILRDYFGIRLPDSSAA